MPNRSIEIHDSVLNHISCVQGAAQLDFSSVYIHQSEGVPGRDAGTGWVQSAVIRISDVTVEGSFLGFPVDLSDGSVRLGNLTFANEIPVPLRHSGPFTLRLQAARDEREVISITGSGAELELLGEPRYVEDFRPLNG
jgi:hypothetical protein